MTHQNKYQLYGPDLIFHGLHFPAAHSGAGVVSCSILLAFGCLPMPLCASSKALALLQCPSQSQAPPWTQAPWSGFPGEQCIGLSSSMYAERDYLNKTKE